MVTHRVTCSTCGRTSRITVPKSGYKCCEKGRGTWHYFGKVNIATRVTSKWFYPVDGVGGLKDMLSGSKSKLAKIKQARIKNPDYNPKAKPRYIEMWECNACFLEAKKSCQEEAQAQ